MQTRTTRSTRRPTAVAGIALAALLGLTACGGGGGSAASGSGGSGSRVAADAAHNEQDVRFVTDMKPHHEQAVEMADLVLAKGVGPEVAALAEKIKAAQEPEITELDRLLAAFDVEQDGGGHGSGHGGGHSGSSMAGMMSADDMRALEAATGPEAERLFLEGMLEHHEGAVAMATDEVDAGEHPEALELARRIKADQQTEIAQMRQLLSRA